MQVSKVMHLHIGMPNHVVYNALGQLHEKVTCMVLVLILEIFQKLQKYVNDYDYNSEYSSSCIQKIILHLCGTCGLFTVLISYSRLKCLWPMQYHVL